MFGVSFWYKGKQWIVFLDRKDCSIVELLMNLDYQFKLRVKK